MSKSDRSLSKKKVVETETGENTFFGFEKNNLFCQLYFVLLLGPAYKL